MELIKDYQFTINYHPGKANTVADALSRKPRTHKQVAKRKQKTIRKEKAKIAILTCSFYSDIQKLSEHDFHRETSGKKVFLACLKVESPLVHRIILSQQTDEWCVARRAQMLSEEKPDWTIDGCLLYTSDAADD